MDVQMYRQHCAHARSSSLHISVADLASASLVLWPWNIRGVTRRLSTGRKLSSTFPTATQHLVSCHCSKLLFVPAGHVEVQKPEERSEGRKREPPVLPFPIMLEELGEFGGGVFDLRVPPPPHPHESLGEVGVQRDCRATC